MAEGHPFNSFRGISIAAQKPALLFRPGTAYGSSHDATSMCMSTIIVDIDLETLRASPQAVLRRLQEMASPDALRELQQRADDPMPSQQDGVRMLATRGYEEPLTITFERRRRRPQKPRRRTTMTRSE